MSAGAAPGGAAWRTASICAAEHRGSVGVKNAVSTVKYKISAGRPWFPYAIVEQFRRIANIYYLVVSALMLVGEQAPQLWVTPYESWSTAGVLVFVLVLTALKEGVEDLRRLRSDRAENGTLVLARTPAKGEVRWEDLRVGDLVIVRDRQALPADAVLLTSSAPNGVAYVDTANIDGETNLKLREPPAEVAHALGANEDARVVGTVSFEPPSRHIHTFNGAIRLDPSGAGSAPSELPLSASSLLLRGSVLRNVDFALAVVVYTGSESKVAMNSQETPSKMSLVERTINASLGAIMVPYLAFTTVSAAIASTGPQPLSARRWRGATRGAGRRPRGGCGAMSLSRSAATALALRPSLRHDPSCAAVSLVVTRAIPRRACYHELPHSLMRARSGLVRPV